MVTMMETLCKYRSLRIAAFLLPIVFSVGLLAACAPSATSITASDTATVADAAASSADAEAAAPRAAPGSITEDFTLIGQTGRPQFLNSYADW